MKTTPSSEADLCAESLNLDGLGLMFWTGSERLADYGTMLQETGRQVTRGTYNEKNGIILFRSKAENGEHAGYFAAPFTVDRQAEINRLGFTKSESIAVPALGDRDLWGNLSAATTRASFFEWHKLVSRASDDKIISFHAGQAELSGKNSYGVQVAPPLFKVVK